MSQIIRRVANLLAIKSLVTLVLTYVYCYMLVNKMEIPESFQTIYLMIVGFFFGSQAEKIQAAMQTTAALQEIAAASTSSVKLVQDVIVPEVTDEN